jgi:hypothetical protein
MRTTIGLSMLLAGLMGCSVTTSTAPTPGLAAVPAAPANAAASSGGTSLEAAEPVSHGQTVEGWVMDETSRYYRLELAAGETLSMTFYSQTDRGSANATLGVLDELGGKLFDRMVTVSGTADWSRDEMTYTATTGGPVLLRAACYKCLDGKVRYKLAIQ